jgi:Winged helix DNA-binding domain
VRSFTIGERRARLARRSFLTEEAPGDSVQAITAAMVGLHATDPATPYLSLWARTPGFAVADLDRELYRRRSVVKHLAMRRTLWLVRAEDLPAIQPGASDRVADNERRRLVADAQRAGVATNGQAWLDRASEAVLRYLADNGPASASEMRAALPELTGTYDPAPGKRYGGQTPLAPRVFTVLSVRGDIVRGPNDGAWTVSRPRWANIADWLGATPDVMPTEKARAELLGRWLRAFGPATLADVKWWFGTTLTAARRALNDIGAVEVDIDGTPGIALPDDLQAEPDVEPWCALLPGLDVTTMGWAHRAWYLGDHRAQVFDANGNAGPTAWCNGRVFGGWYQDADGRVRLQLLEDPGRDGRKALERKVSELSDWLAGTRVSPRFPSVLSKAAR